MSSDSFVNYVPDRSLADSKALSTSVRESCVRRSCDSARRLPWYARAMIASSSAASSSAIVASTLLRRTRTSASISFASPSIRWASPNRCAWWAMRFRKLTSVPIATHSSRTCSMVNSSSDSSWSAVVLRVALPRLSSSRRLRTVIHTVRPPMTPERRTPRTETRTESDGHTVRPNVALEPRPRSEATRGPQAREARLRRSARTLG